ncbi:MAG TPA: glycosyltransferase [Steroidobacteraceae bacterium]|nr:glycosyltransferase [Steroidobacteraceae bacterium]
MLVSVYLATHDRVELLSRAVDSVLQQTYPHIELVIANDGSSDGTRDYLDALQRREARVRVLHNPGSLGAPRARNRAIQAARGALITGLDDDDRFHPERIAGLVDHWQLHGSRYCCSYTQDHLVWSDRSQLTKKPETVTADELFFFNSIGNQVFTRRDFLLDAGLFDAGMPAWQDLDLFIRLLRRFGPAKLLDRGLYYLNLQQHGARISSGSRQRILNAYSRLLRKHVQMPPAMKQGLYLQAFGPLYETRLGHRDVKEFFSHGVHARPLKRLAGLLLRQAFSP